MKPLRLLGLLLMIGMSVAMPAFAGPPDAPSKTKISNEYPTKERLELAKKGDAFSQSILGDFYNVGKEGVPPDYVEAAKWYLRSAEQGDAYAQMKIAGMYDTGEGVPQDSINAVKWWKKSAEQGNVYAHFNLGIRYRHGDGVTKDEYAEAVKWYLKMAKSGDVDAINMLGFMYMWGKGVPQDYAEAVKWYTKTAEQGDAYAQSNLGLMCRHGQGVPQDYTKAVKWFRKAAEQGDAIAQLSLGQMYFIGSGVKKDYVEAHKLFNLAAARSTDDSRDIRAECVKFRDIVVGLMTPKQLTEAQKRASEWRPTENPPATRATINSSNSKYILSLLEFAQKGDAVWQHTIGMKYEYGQDGVPKNFVEAYKWYSLAATRSTDKSEYGEASLRDKIAAKMTPAQIAEAQKLAREWKPTK